MGEKLEVVPGTEFRVAYEEAVRCGASVTLGDRPIQVLYVDPLCNVNFRDQYYVEDQSKTNNMAPFCRIPVLFIVQNSTQV